MCCFGVIVLGFGIFRWNKIQKVNDRRAEVQLEQDELKLRDMKPAEIKEKISNEISEVATLPSEKSSQEEFFARYTGAEAKVRGLLHEGLSPKYRVASQKKISGKFIDILVEPANALAINHKAYVIEVKLRGASVNRADLRRSYLQTVDATLAAEGSAQWLAESRLVVIFDKGAFERENFEKVKSQIYSEFPQFALKHRIFGFSLSEIDSLSPKRFSQKIEITNP
jgi:hypothetical protein